MRSVSEKICIKCKGKPQPLENFYKSGGTYRSECKSCFKLYYSANKARFKTNSKSWKKSNADHVRKEQSLYHARNPDNRKKSNLKHRYGITEEQYEDMLLKQNNLCASCEEPETCVDPRTKVARRLSVDHNHETKKVRGLLCHDCNRAEGILRGNPDKARKLADYMERTKD